MSQVIEEIGNYRILKSKPLGVGATGSVFFGQNKDGMKVAVKSIEIKKITKSVEKQVENEIKNLTTLSSPFIVKLYDYFRSGDHIYMVLEYCEDGDLKNYLSKKKEGLSEAEALTFMRHLMHGYSTLLSTHIIHRDIKPANILLKQGVAKLSDFGFSRVVEDPNKTQKLTLLGTPLYTAPEILANQDFSNKCDVWSMGIVFYEMLHAHTPWTGKDLEDLRHNIEKRKIEFKPTINPDIK
jgi:serine/threonine-protein kinase ULK/ATG1